MALSRTGKGILAGSVALALLLGGGTFALWYQTEDIGTGTVGSGELSFSVVGSQWTNTRTGTVIDPNAFLIVPGDTIQLETDITINAQGDNLTATLSVDAADITDTNELGDALQTSFTLDPALPSAGTNAFQITPEENGDVFTATVSITFPETTGGDPATPDRSDWWGQQAQNQTVNLDAITFDLAQDDPTP